LQLVFGAYESARTGRAIDLQASSSEAAMI